jgi:hypothetical protein
VPDHHLRDRTAHARSLVGEPREIRPLLVRHTRTRACGESLAEENHISAVLLETLACQ